MTQEDKDLLLKDLLVRLPYGVKVNVLIHKEDKTSNEILILNGFQGDSEYTLWVYDEKILAKYGCSGRGFYIEEVKPYLRSMSSMTDEERDEWLDPQIKAELEAIKESKSDNEYNPSVKATIYSIDWLNSHHFDYRGLIEKGLAIEVKENTLVNMNNNPYDNTTLGFEIKKGNYYKCLQSQLRFTDDTLYSFIKAEIYYAPQDNVITDKFKHNWDLSEKPIKWILERFSSI